MRRVAPLLLVALLACFLAHSQSKQASEGELQQWTLQRTFVGHTVSVHSVAFSPDGKTVASASWDRSIILWDIETGAKKLGLKHGYHPHRVIFSPDGQFLYSSGGDGTIKKWDLETGRANALVSGRNEIVNLSLSSDGALLACDCRPKAAEVLDARTGARKLTASQGDDVWAVALSPDGKLLAVAGGDKRLPVVLWDVQTVQVLRKFSGIKNAGSVAFSSDSRVLAVGSQEDENIKLFNTATGELLQTLSKSGSRFSQLEFSPDGRLLAATPDVMGQVYFYDLREQQWTSVLKTDGSISEVAFSADGKLLATAGYTDKAVRIWSNPAP
jgi:WD40 repeat protein